MNKTQEIADMIRRITANNGWFDLQGMVDADPSYTPEAIRAAATSIVQTRWLVWPGEAEDRAVAMAAALLRELDAIGAVISPVNPSDSGGPNSTNPQPIDPVDSGGPNSTNPEPIDYDPIQMASEPPLRTTNPEPIGVDEILRGPYDGPILTGGITPEQPVSPDVIDTRGAGKIGMLIALGAAVWLLMR